MKEPKITMYPQNKIWMLIFYKDRTRMRKSLGTRDEVKARLLYESIIGLPLPANATSPEPTEDPGKAFVKAYNAFFKSKYGLESAWANTPKGQCTKRSTVMRGTLKGFKKYTRIAYLPDIRYCHIQSFAYMKVQTCKNAAVNNHIQRLRRFLKFCVNHTIGS